MKSVAATSRRASSAATWTTAPASAVSRRWRRRSRSPRRRARAQALEHGRARRARSAPPPCPWTLTSSAGRPEVSSTAVVQDGDAVAERLGLVHVVGDQHDGRAPSRTRSTQRPRPRRAAGSRPWVSSSRKTSRAGRGARARGTAVAAGRPTGCANGVRQQRLQAPSTASRDASTTSPGRRAKSRSASPTRSRSGRPRSAAARRSSGAAGRRSRAGSRPSTSTGHRRGARRPWRISTVVVLPAPLRAERCRRSRPADREGHAVEHRLSPYGFCRPWTSIGVRSMPHELGPGGCVGHRSAGTDARAPPVGGARRLPPRGPGATTPWS